MRNLEDMSPTDERFWPAVGQLSARTGHHVHEQEFHIFPVLRRTCSDDELVELGRLADQSGKLAPTRPHPASPHEGAALALIAPGVGLVDRIRDALTGRGR
ncbi:MAG: hypothetical protein GEU74_15140 [Nitriliruptorales bacterium]|nr:hypothetical protein [Nitriliruptorales bacterium]